MTSPNPLVAALIALVGPDQVLTGDAAAPYLTDWRKRYTGAAQAVVRPGSTQEVAAVVRCCVEHGVPIVPQGGNTGLAGAATPDASGVAVVLSLQRLQKDRAIDTDNDTITVEAGCILQNVQQAARDAGRLFPLSLASEGSCTVGGNLATNAGGTLVAGQLLSRGLIARWALIMLTSAVMGGCAVALFIAELPHAMVLLLCVVFSGVGGMLPATLVASAPLLSPTPALVPIAIGLVMQGSYLGQVLGPLAVGVVVDRHGWPAAAGVVLVAAVLGMTAGWRLRPSFQRLG